MWQARYVLALLFLATAISYINRQALAVVAPVLRDELDLSNLDYAWIVFWFLLAYTAMQPATGWLVDRLGTRRGFALLMVWWSMATVLHAFGRGVLSFSLYRVMLGAGQAGSWGASVRAVTEWFPRDRRGAANSVWATGVSAGSALAVPLVAGIVVMVGWRTAFAVTGAFGIVWTLLWLASYQPPVDSRESGAGVHGSADPDTRGYREVLFSRPVWALVAARIFADPVVWFYNAWVPEFLVRQGGYTMAEVGRYGWIPFAVYGVGILLGGVLSDCLCRRGHPTLRARLRVMGAGVLCMSAGILAAFPVSMAVALGAISLAVFGFGLWGPNMMTLCGEVAPSGRVASVTGLTGAGAGTGGMLFTLFTGWTVDRVGYAPVFLAAGLAPVAAFAIALRVVGRHAGEPALRLGK